MNREEVLAELNKAGFRVGEVVCKTRLPYMEVEQIAYSAKPPDAGPPHLAPHLVTAKRTDSGWSDREAVLKARQLYNEGTHELVQRSRNGWTWLYSVPRKEPVAYRKYFEVGRP